MNERRPNSNKARTALFATLSAVAAIALAAPPSGPDWSTPAPHQRPSDCDPKKNPGKCAVDKQGLGPAPSFEEPVVVQIGATTLAELMGLQPEATPDQPAAIPLP